MFEQKSDREIRADVKRGHELWTRAIGPLVLKQPLYDRFVTTDNFKESEHPRGQPGNPGQFASKPGGATAKGAEPGGSSSPASKGPTGAALKGSAALKEHKARVRSSVDTYSNLKQVAKLAGPKSRESFLVKNGQPYVANAKTYEGEHGPMQQCYMNSTKAALNNPDRTYVEGYITVHGVPIHHAWTVDKAGQIYDPTLTSDLAKGVTGYYGVPFSTDYLLKATLQNKHYGLLGHLSKTARELFAGETKGFKAREDVDALSNEAIGDRLAFADTVIGQLEDTSTINTPERQKLREQVAEAVYNNNKQNRTQNREATIILGLPGSGKSTLAGNIMNTSLEIDPDAVKEKLPEYDGGVGAFGLHEESSVITRRILQRAISAGDDFVWPRVDSPDKVVKDIESLSKAGYKVHVKYIDVSEDTAVESAIRRYFNNGRYVSPDLVRNYGTSPRAAYEAAVNTGLVASKGAYKRRTEGGFEEIA